MIEGFKNRRDAISDGPGGYKCPCCGPSPKYRTQARRVERRRKKARIARELRDVEGAGIIPQNIF